MRIPKMKVIAGNAMCFQNGVAMFAPPGMGKDFGTVRFCPV